MSIRTISNIYNFKLYRIVYKLKTKYMSTIERLFTIINNLKLGKGKLSITKKKNYQKSRPKIMSADVDLLVIWMGNNNNNNNNNNIYIALIP